MAMFNDTTISALLAGPTPPVNVTAATVTITAASHGNRVITLNRAAGIAVTLPNAVGSGFWYWFFIGTTITSNSTTITRGVTADVMSGVCYQAKAATNLTPVLTASNTNTITMDGSTKCGILGDNIFLMDVGLNQWMLEMLAAASGTLATPFTNT